MKQDVPWRTVALRYLPDGMTLSDVYERMGWHGGVAANRRRWPNLRLQEAAQLAKAVRAPDLGAFLVELALAEGIPNLGEKVTRKESAA